MRILKWVVLIFLIVFVLSVASIYAYLRSTLPDYDGEITVVGLKNKVEIIRDSYGMPHIYAQTDKDAFFALGYCMAQDRLFHMDLVRRVARGRLAEILGESVVSVDRLFRTITAGKSIDEIAHEFPSHIKSAGKAYAEGINYYLENRNGPLPIEFTLLGYRPEPFTFEDGAAVHYYMAWDLNGAFSNEMLYASVIKKVGEDLARNIFPDYAEEYPIIMPDGSATMKFLKTLYSARKILGVEGGGASNNWVISGKKSETGKPILANDPHLGHGAPGIWYEAHLVTPSINVSGSILPGIPYVVIGANEHVAWGFTNVMADDADFYIEKIKPDDPNKYLYKGHWEEMKIKEEIIKVKGGDDVTLNVRLTRHGPIVDDVNGYEEPKGTVLSMRWAAYEKLKAIEAFRYLNRAKSIDDIEKAVEFFKCPGQNWVYADDRGNIGFWAAVGIPARIGFSGAVPVPGWDGNHEWRGYVPTRDQPHLRNPTRGWIATANNKHVGDNYPFPISHYYAMPDRYIRIQEMLTEKDKLGVDDFKRMHNDFYMVLAREWVPIMIKSLSGKRLSERQQKALSALQNWDFIASADGIPPTIFHATINAIVKNTFQKRLGDELYDQYIRNSFVAFNSLRNMIAKGRSAWFDDPETQGIEGMDEIITKSFKDGVAYLDREMGSNVKDWIWGKLHTLTISHPFGKSSALMGFFLNIGPFPMGGSLATVNPQPYKLSDPWAGFHGASLRYISRRVTALYHRFFEHEKFSAGHPCRHLR
jgi:penicillin amidase